VAAVRLELATNSTGCTIHRRVGSAEGWEMLPLATPIAGQLVIFLTDGQPEAQARFRAFAVNSAGVRSRWSDMIIVEPA
jgi:hypothetical protein